MYAVHHYLHFFQIVVIGKRLIGLWSIGRYCYYLWFSWKNRVEPIQRAPLCTDGCRMGSEQTDPLKAHQTTIFSWMGFRIDPCNTSELVG